MTARPGVSFVVPVHDERENLAPLVAEIEALARGRGWSFEILLVNDGSTDGSTEEIDALAERHAEVRGLHLDRNHGQSAALAAGFEHARGERIVTLDADGQNDPRDIPALLDLLAEYDLAIGYRVERADGSARRLASWIANRVRDRVTGDEVLDIGCSLKAFRAEAVTNLLGYAGMHRYLPTLARLHGWSFVQHPVRHRPRKHGRSKYGILDRAWTASVDLFAVRWMMRRRFRYRVVRESGRAAARRGSRTVGG